MDGLPAEVNLYDFIKYIRFSYGLTRDRLDRKEARARGRQALPAHVGKRQFMAAGG
jgi:hypothetical protein